MRHPSMYLMFSLMLVASCGGSGSDGSGAAAEAANDSAQNDTAQTDPAQTDPAQNDPAQTDGDQSSAEDVLSAAPVLQPVFSFALEGFDQVNQVALSPDGSRMVAVSQAALGDPVTMRFHDTATGEQIGTVEFETIGIGRVHWMADDRLVILNTGIEGQWHTWDGSTFEELSSFLNDDTCSDGVADKTTGAIYSSQGLTSPGDDICRLDTTDGSTTRTAGGLLVSADQYWVRPGANELVVLHSPDESVARELMALDGTTLEPTARTVLPYNESVLAVASSTWIADFDTAEHRLEPGGSDAPDIRDPLESSGAGTMFYSSNGSADLVFISAADGSIAGTMTAGMNPSSFSDWSIDDSTFIRVTVDGVVEVYRF